MQEAPLEVQKKAKCIIGKDYPEPIVDHKEIHKVNIDRMKEAYDANRKNNVSSKNVSEDGPASKKAKHK